MKACHFDPGGHGVYTECEDHRRVDLINLKVQCIFTSICAEVTELQPAEYSNILQV